MQPSADFCHHLAQNIPVVLHFSWRNIQSPKPTPQALHKLAPCVPLVSSPVVYLVLLSLPLHWCSDVLLPLHWLFLLPDFSSSRLLFSHLLKIFFKASLSVRPLLTTLFKIATPSRESLNDLSCSVFPWELPASNIPHCTPNILFAASPVPPPHIST